MKFLGLETAQNTETFGSYVLIFRQGLLGYLSRLAEIWHLCFYTLLLDFEWRGGRFCTGAKRRCVRCWQKIAFIKHYIVTCFIMYGWKRSGVEGSRCPWRFCYPVTEINFRLCRRMLLTVWLRRCYENNKNERSWML